MKKSRCIFEKFAKSRDFCPSISIYLKYDQVGKVAPFFFTFDSHSLWHPFKRYFVICSKCRRLQDQVILYIILSKFNHYSTFTSTNINKNIKKITILQYSFYSDHRSWRKSEVNHKSIKLRRYFDIIDSHSLYAFTNYFYFIIIRFLSFIYHYLSFKFSI